MVYVGKLHDNQNSVAGLIICVNYMTLPKFGKNLLAAAINQAQGSCNELND